MEKFTIDSECETGYEVLFEFEVNNSNCLVSLNPTIEGDISEPREYYIGTDEPLIDLDDFFSHHELQHTAEIDISAPVDESAPRCFTDHEFFSQTSVEPIIHFDDFLQPDDFSVAHDSINDDDNVSPVEIVRAPVDEGFTDHETFSQTSVEPIIDLDDFLQPDDISVAQDSIDDNDHVSPNEIVRAVKIKKTSKKDQSRLQRESGSSYLGYSRRASKVVQNSERPARKQGLPCGSSFCLKSSRRHCNLFPEHERRTLFKMFWKMTWPQKEMYVCNLIQTNKIKQRTTEETVSRRQNTYKYFLNTAKGKRIQVCRRMFLATFGLKAKMVRSWVNREGEFGLRENPAAVQSRKNASREKSETYRALLDRKIKLLSFLIEYPKLESHYCRKDTEKEYFQTTHQTLIDLYKQYAEVCQSENSIQLSFPVFSGTLKSLNLCLFKPRKDQCDTCSAFKVGNLNPDEFKTHRNDVDRAANEKEKDLKAAKMKLIVLLCMDAEGVVLCPKIKASLQYYKSKLQLHNFTIYDILSHDSWNYIWDETESDLQSSTFTSIVVHHLEKIFPSSSLPVTIYSDGCGYQNRNVVIANALRLLAMKHSRVITQKFLEVGHTHMECDSTHACIERKTRDMTLNLPIDFEAAVKEARDIPFPYQVEHLTHTFFRNFDDDEYLTLKTIRPGKKPGDPKVNDIRCLQYTASGEILYKLRFDEEFQVLPQKLSEPSTTEPKSLHEYRLAVSFQKWKHLQEMKPALDPISHPFYDNIPHCEEPAKITTKSEKLQNIMRKIHLVKSAPKPKIIKEKRGSKIAQK